MSEVLDKFLDEWAKRSIEYYKNLYVQYRSIPKLDGILKKIAPEIEDLKRNREYRFKTYEEIVKRQGRDSEVYKKCAKIMEEHHEKYGKIIKSCPTYLMDRDVYENEMFSKIVREERKEAEEKKRYLRNRLKGYCGEITSVEGLKIGYDSGINGIITGERGRAKIETILAGGYNIQRLHLRVLVHPLDGQDKVLKTHAELFKNFTMETFNKLVERHIEELFAYFPIDYYKALERNKIYKLDEFMKTQPNITYLMSVREVPVYLFEHKHELYVFTPFSLMKVNIQSKIMVMIYAEYMDINVVSFKKWLNKEKLGAVADYISFGYENTSPKIDLPLTQQEWLLAHTKDLVTIQKKNAYMKYDTKFDLKVLNGTKKDTLKFVGLTQVKLTATESFTPRCEVHGYDIKINGARLNYNGKTEDVLQELKEKFEYSLKVHFKKDYQVEIQRLEGVGNFANIICTLDNVSMKNKDTYRKNLNGFLDILIRRSEETLQSMAQGIDRELRQLER